MNPSSGGTAAMFGITWIFRVFSLNYSQKRPLIGNIIPAERQLAAQLFQDLVAVLFGLLATLRGVLARFHYFDQGQMFIHKICSGLRLGSRHGSVFLDYKGDSITPV
jgi:hypothetical protein